MSCTLCHGAMPEGEWCRSCGEGLPADPPRVDRRRPLFDGTGCGHPPDPVAENRHGNWWCHCGRTLDPDAGFPEPSAPGPVVPCRNCGCFVAIPLARAGGS